MENVLLIVLLLLALALIGVVLLQRSEGGGLGLGGGGGAGGGVMSGRAAASALTKLTWILGAAFMAASLGMTVIAAQKSSGSSVIDRLGVEVPATESGENSGSTLLPPTAPADQPLTPHAE